MSWDSMIDFLMQTLAFALVPYAVGMFFAKGFLKALSLDEVCFEVKKLAIAKKAHISVEVRQFCSRFLADWDSFRRGKDGANTETSSRSPNDEGLEMKNTEVESQVWCACLAISNLKRLGAVEELASLAKTCGIAVQDRLSECPVYTLDPPRAQKMEKPDEPEDA